MREHPPQLEIDTFTAINRLPDGLYAPIWLVMQLGAFATVPMAAGAARLLGHRTLAVRLLVSGTTTWLGAKAIKRAVGRGRAGAQPQALIVFLYWKHDAERGLRTQPLGLRGRAGGAVRDDRRHHRW